MAASNPKIPHEDNVVGLDEDCEGIFNIFRGTLQLDMAVADKARKICMDIDFLVADAFLLPDDEGVFHTPIYNIWNAMLILSCYIPADHPWQDALVETIQILRKRKGEMAPGDKEWMGRTWKQLPELRESIDKICMQDAPKWAISDDLDSRWENFTSFLARINENDDAPSFDMAMFDLIHGLEKPMSDIAKPRDALWCATEWLTRCPGVFYCGKDDGLAFGPKGGPLCPSIKPWSLERWEFWKKRLDEIKANASEILGRDDVEMIERIGRARAAMEAAEKQGKTK